MRSTKKRVTRKAYLVAGLGYGHESVIVTFTTLTDRTETVLTERLIKILIIQWYFPTNHLQE